MLAAEVKGGELLLRLLTEREKRQFARDGYLRVRPRGFAGLFGTWKIGQTTRGSIGVFKRHRRRCVAVNGYGLPQSDEVLAYYLAIKANPALFAYHAVRRLSRHFHHLKGRTG